MNSLGMLRSRAVDRQGMALDLRNLRTPGRRVGCELGERRLNARRFWRCPWTVLSPHKAGARRLDRSGIIEAVGGGNADLRSGSDRGGVPSAGRLGLPVDRERAASVFLYLRRRSVALVMSGDALRRLEIRGLVEANGQVGGQLTISDQNQNKNQERERLSERRARFSYAGRWDAVCFQHYSLRFARLY